ncbi:hypothetical protein RZA67_13255 [Stenotrophomonas sp. C3(2023)]|uniref:hypothetical protein n=1 Tax=Stenotrophomonas sp. C3(2023) TaxID=3080277 RepID=UPI00293C2698|nr:hypothetical protein [Stenotrophomonas sp. C3(2023)]MDV3469685.1 hypothetical protein [Stenotrophomonas sp. C3(2023)]
MKSPRLYPRLPLLMLGVLGLAACGDKAGKENDVAATTEPSASPASQEQATPQSPWQGTESIKPVFPDEMASKEMNLDYDSYQFEEGGLSVAPLPPFFKRSVDVELTDATRSYSLTAGRAACAYKIKVSVGDGEGKLLDPKMGEKMEITPETFAGASSLQLHIALADDADQNWSCNLHIAPAVKL